MKSLLAPLAVCCLLAATARGQSAHITVLDCGRDSIVAVLEGAGCTVWPVAYGHNSNHVYAWSYQGLLVVDCSADTIVDCENVYFQPDANRFAHDTIDNKLYGLRAISQIIAYDCDSLSVVDTIEIDGNVRSIAWTARGNKVYLADDWHKTIQVLDCSSDSIVRSIGPLDRVPNALCPVEAVGKLYFGREQAVGVVDMAADSLLPDIPGTAWPYLMQYFASTNRLLAYLPGHGIFVIDCARGIPVDWIGCPAFGTWALDTRDSRLYLCGETALYALDLVTGVVSDTIPLMLSAVLWDSLDNKVYGIRERGSVYGDTLWVVDCSTNAVIGCLQIPDTRTAGFVWNPVMNKLYVGGDNENPAVNSAHPLPVTDHAILSTPTRKLPAGMVVFDAMGRRVTNSCSGVYFVRSAGDSRPTRVVVVR